ncbi:hypothetical protein COOONC_12367 [Cooperia oncophora]
MVLEPDGKAHGVLFLNSNAQEVTTTPGSALIYRTIGGNLDLYFFPGPTPGEVTQQYLAFIGKPLLPAYWALGFQLSRWGYKDFDDLKNAVKRTKDAGIPLEVVVFDIDYMERFKDFTINPYVENFHRNSLLLQKWKDLPSYVRELHTQGMRTIFMFDPAIDVSDDAFKRAMEMVSAKKKFK